MSQDKDNNEAASALSQQAYLLASWLKSGCCTQVEGEKLRGDILEWLTSNGAAPLAASASQSSTPVPRVGGNTFDELLSIGGSMSNMLYNIAQGSFTLAEYADNARTLQKKWDAARSDLAHVARQRQESEYSYASTQATNCATCGEHKHTPLRIDAMGGYVCLTCIDNRLGSLLGEFGYVSPTPSAAVAEGVDTAELRKLLQEWGRVPYQWDALIAYLTAQFAQQREAGRQEVVEGVKEFARCQLDAARLEVAKDCVAALAAAPPAKAEGMSDQAMWDAAVSEAGTEHNRFRGECIVLNSPEEVGDVFRAILAQQAKKGGAA